MNNEDALCSNKLMATDLIANFNEVRDLQERPEHFFINKEIHLDDDFPDQHFTLLAQIGTNQILINFWKDSVCFELGFVQDVAGLFKSLHHYAKQIITYGFLIEHPENDDLMPLKEGIDVNLQEYINWLGLVNRVINTTGGSSGFVI